MQAQAPHNDGGWIMKFIFHYSINNKPALVKIVAWRDKPSSKQITA